MFTGIQALVFDFDGTLVDASAAICRAFNHALQESGHPTRPDAEIRRLIGHPLRDMFPQVVDGLSDTELARLIADYRKAFAPIACELSQPMPGLHAMLAHFLGRARLGIATSRMSDGAQQILGAMDLLDAFEVIVGLQDVEQAKPHPEPVHRVLAALQVAPEQAIMIGDVPGDMQAGRAAGTHTVGIASAEYPAEILVEAGADAIISRLDALIELITLCPSGMRED